MKDMAHHLFGLATCLLMLSFPLPSVFAGDRFPSPEHPYRIVNGVRLVEGQTFVHTLDIDGPDWDGAIIRNNVFAFQKDKGLHISNVKDLVIEDNDFYGMLGNAIKLRSEQLFGTDNVLIRNNYFHDMPNTAILSGEPNTGMRIIGNRFENVALDSSGNKKHAMYLKGPGFLVEDNDINGVGDGHGISVRTSGVVRGNTVTGAGEFGIKYYASSQRKGNGLLVIENNVVTKCKLGGISLETDHGVLIDHAVVRFNTIADCPLGLRTEAGLQSVRIELYGNLIVDQEERYYDLQSTPDIFIGNIGHSTSDIFQAPAMADYRLTPMSLPRNAVGDSPGLPPYDKDQRPMGDPPYDAGAFQFHE